MRFLKRNFPWMIAAILATLPLMAVFGFVDLDFSNGFTVSLNENQSPEGRTSLEMLYHITGEFAIRWMTAVLSLTPFFIIFGVSNLFVRQAMGIATAVWSFLHFIIFVWLEGFMETFTQVNYIAGFIVILILIPMFLSSNRKSMRLLKSTWKKLQSLVYLAVLLSLLHIAILNKTWIIYAVIVGIGFVIRIPMIKHKLIQLRANRKSSIDSL